MSAVSQTNLRRCLAVIAVLLISPSAFGGDSTTSRQPTPREVYNDATRKLGEGKLREAEAGLQTAVASQDERVQTAALYNLGQVRFQAGLQDLTNTANAKAVDSTSFRANQVGRTAIRAIDDAMASGEVAEMVAAYQHGRGARKELNSAIEAVRRAMETYGAVLTKWRRASGDFKSAQELRPADTASLTNAELVDRWIARVVDMVQPMMQRQPEMQGTREELRKKLQELKQKLPPDIQEKMKNEGGEEDEDEDGSKVPKEPKQGQEEGPRKQGKEMHLTPEEARRLLGLLRLDAERKLSVGGIEEAGKPLERNGKDW